MKKTNVMRILDSKKINYKSYSYDIEERLSGVGVAKLIDKDENQVFKTLVTQGDTDYFVFVIPVNLELDLKKAAKAARVKKINLIKEKLLLPLTGYIHGGCSPIGMKKFFKTFIDKRAENFEEIIFNGGKIGTQVELSLKDLEKIIDFTIIDLI